jgi:histone H3/H4
MAIPSILLEFTAPEPVSGSDLAMYVNPLTQAIRSMFPKARFSDKAVLECCEAIAEIANDYRKKEAALEKKK